MRNDIQLSRLVAKIDRDLAADGYAISQSSDHAAFEAAHQALSGRSAASPPLNSRYVDLDPADFFWLDVTKDGRRIAVEAMRREHITQPLRRHLDQQYRRFYTAEADLKIIGHAPGADLITGVIVYHGDLFVDPSLRGNGLATQLSRLAILIAYQRWDPDFIWGFIAEEKVLRGYQQKIGYWHGQPYGTQYSDKPEDISEKDWLVWMSREDLSYWTELSRRSRELA